MANVAGLSPIIAGTDVGRIGQVKGPRTPSAHAAIRSGTVALTSSRFIDASPVSLTKKGRIGEMDVGISTD